MPELIKTILANNANLKAYYRFESGALTTDSSGNGHTLTNQTAVAETASGKYGGGASFNGSHYMYTANTTALNITGNITVGCWVYFNAVAEKGLVSKGLHGDTTFQWALRTSSTGKLAFGVDDNGSWGPAGDAVASQSYSSGQWYFVVGVYDGAAVRLYIDGKCETTTAYSSGIVSKTGNVYIGTFFDTSYLVNAVIDEVFIFSSALSADQIKELYEGRYYGELRPNQFGTTAGLWHLNGNSTDSSGNGNNGTDTNITYSQANGKFGQGAGFNGSSSYISIPASSALDFTGNFSIAVWLYPTSVTDIRVIFHRHTNATAGWNWYMNDNVMTMVTSTTGTNNTSTTDSALTINAWNHVVVVRNSAAVNFYKNGNLLVNSASGTHTTVTSVSKTMQIGRDPSGAQFFSGNMEEAYFTATALTANQIRTMYALGVGKYY